MVNVSAFVNYASRARANPTSCLAQESQRLLMWPSVPVRSFVTSYTILPFTPKNARLLVAGAEGREAELARLQTAAVDVHALLAVLIGDREHVVAAVEVVLHQAAALLVRVQNVHLGRVQAED